MDLLGMIISIFLFIGIIGAAYAHIFKAPRQEVIFWFVFCGVLGFAGFFLEWQSLKDKGEQGKLREINFMNAILTAGVGIVLTIILGSFYTFYASLGTVIFAQFFPITKKNLQQ